MSGTEIQLAVMDAHKKWKQTRRIPAYFWESIRERIYAEAYRDGYIALIPEGAVLVTEETLTAAVGSMGRIWVDESVAEPFAAAILRHLRERTK